MLNMLQRDRKGKEKATMEISTTRRKDSSQEKANSRESSSPTTTTEMKEALTKRATLMPKGPKIRTKESLTTMETEKIATQKMSKSRNTTIKRPPASQKSKAELRNLTIDSSHVISKHIDSYY